MQPGLRASCILARSKLRTVQCALPSHRARSSLVRWSRQQSIKRLTKSCFNSSSRSSLRHSSSTRTDRLQVAGPPSHTLHRVRRSETFHTKSTSRTHGRRNLVGKVKCCSASVSRWRSRKSRFLNGRGQTRPRFKPKISPSFAQTCCATRKAIGRSRATT